MLEGIARIEGEAYTLLRDLGASELTSVLTAGGGASNDTWTRIRSRRLGVDVSSSPHGAHLIPSSSGFCCDSSAPASIGGWTTGAMHAILNLMHSHTCGSGALQGRRAMAPLYSPREAPHSTRFSRVFECEVPIPATTFRGAPRANDTSSQATDDGQV